MPTWEKTDQFKRDEKTLTEDERKKLKAAVAKFRDDLATGRGFRPGLRVKPMQDAEGIFEMTWEIKDGRATFEYGTPLTEGVTHIIWRRVGGHGIFGNP
ncbi:MAG: hypothetical protein GEU78_14230 [Actinobacteria bacterium]|nr:hypothetical protein [Actinomycetota bacterium]